MPQIIPISELRNSTEILEKCQEQKEPIYITKNGYGSMVIMDIDVFHDLMSKINKDK